MKLNSWIRFSIFLVPFHFVVWFNILFSIQLKFAYLISLFHHRPHRDPGTFGTTPSLLFIINFKMYFESFFPLSSFIDPRSVRESIIILGILSECVCIGSLVVHWCLIPLKFSTIRILCTAIPAARSSRSAPFQKYTRRENLKSHYNIQYFYCVIVSH